MKELNKIAMERIKTGHFGKIGSFTNIIEHMAEMVNQTNAGNADYTMAFHDEETGLIPEVIIRVRKPIEDE